MFRVSASPAAGSCQISLPPLFQEIAAVPRRISRALQPLSVLALTLAISGCIGTGGIAPQGKALEANTLVTDEAIRAPLRMRIGPPHSGGRPMATRN
jgi:hypothetical protein